MQILFQGFIVLEAFLVELEAILIFHRSRNPKFVENSKVLQERSRR